MMDLTGLQLLIKHQEESIKLYHDVIKQVELFPFQKQYARTALLILAYDIVKKDYMHHDILFNPNDFEEDRLSEAAYRRAMVLINYVMPSEQQIPFALILVGGAFYRGADLIPAKRTMVHLETHTISKKRIYDLVVKDPANSKYDLIYNESLSKQELTKGLHMWTHILRTPYNRN